MKGSITLEDFDAKRHHTLHRKLSNDRMFVYFPLSRSLRRGSYETFAIPGSKSIGILQRIQVQQKYLSWLLKWKLNKVSIQPGWTGTPSDKNNKQL